MDPEVSFPFSKNPATGPYQMHPVHTIPPIYLRSILILSYHLLLGRFYLKVFQSNYGTHLSSFPLTAGLLLYNNILRCSLFNAAVPTTEDIWCWTLDIMSGDIGLGGSGNEIICTFLGTNFGNHV